MVNYKSAEGSIIQLSWKINTFLLLKKNSFNQGDGHRGQRFGKRGLSYFQYISSENRGTFVPVTSVKHRGVKSETRSVYLTKEKLLWGISSERERKTRVPAADGSFIVMAGGGEHQRETRDHKKGWRHGWTVTHVPQRRGILLSVALVCHHVTSPVRSLHPVGLRRIVLHCKWTRE